MGPHQSLVNQEERWKLVCYVQKLIAPAEGGAAKDSVGTGNVAPPAGTAATKSAEKK